MFNSTDKTNRKKIRDSVKTFSRLYEESQIDSTAYEYFIKKALLYEILSSSDSVFDLEKLNSKINSIGKVKSNVWTRGISERRSYWK